MLEAIEKLYKTVYTSGPAVCYTWSKHSTSQLCLSLVMVPENDAVNIYECRKRQEASGDLKPLRDRIPEERFTDPKDRSREK